VEDKPPARFNRAAVKHGTIGSLARIEAQLLKQPAHTDPGSLMADADSDRAILVMDTHGDHCPLKARITDSGHGQKQLAGQEAGRVHADENAPGAKALQVL
jgi:hypothetical protein